MNKIELEDAILRKQMSRTELAEKIGVNRVTLYRKIASGKFERGEIQKIRDTLGLSDADVIRIFFEADSCENATEQEDA